MSPLDLLASPRFPAVTLAAASSLLLACPGARPGGAGDDDDDAADDDSPEAPCEYPPGAPEEMAEGEVLPRFSWPAARDASGSEAPLDLLAAHCGDASDAWAWSPYDAILFVSLPAW
jgi:hypothetical protein